MPLKRLPFLAAALGLALVAVMAAPSEALAEDLISGIGLTQLTVYDQRPAPDGLMSGSPHVHAVTDEGYYVMSGKGRVELHDLKDGFRSVDLLPGRYVQFPPGTLHRLVNSDHLVLLVVMGNAGLAERGDARIYFGRRVDDDPLEFARLTGLAKANGLEGALDRRDAAIRAYSGLVGLWTKDRKAYHKELERFIGVHMKAAAAMRQAFTEAVEAGPVAWGERFRQRVGALPGAAGEAAPILHLAPETTTLGMCGVLRPVTGFEPVGPAKDAGPRK
ncbi:MAG: cupin domain-containing protein [Candidatus Aminicenantes bacterium]|nr:MAG: cupin domain-containing protein [Candidatus Aminicenantes bacterium]